MSYEPLGSPLFRRLLSFRYAARGIVSMIRSEPNARIHLFMTLLVLGAGVYFRIERSEWLAVALAIGGVFAAESLNTAFEALCDVASPRRNPQVERAKDVAAGAVLIAATAATSVGLLVFGPRVWTLLAG